MSYPIQSEATDLAQANKARRAGWKVAYPKCPHGEHRYITGRRTCPDCGEDL